MVMEQNDINEQKKQDYYVTFPSVNLSTSYMFESIKYFNVRGGEIGFKLTGKHPF